MKLSKRILKHSLVQSALCRLVWAYGWLVFFTARIDREIALEAAPYMASEKHAVFAFWHGQLMMMPYLRAKKRPTSALISQHRDGALLAKIMGYLGIETIAGSSSKGALAAIKQMLTALKAGQNVIITPDGPRGPAKKAAAGVAQVPAKAGVPILPCSCAASRARYLRSWDRFMIPLPFSRIVLVIDAPLVMEPVKGAHATEAACRTIEDALNAATHRAETLAAASKAG